MEIEGILNVTVDSLLIENYGNFEVVADGQVLLDGPGQTKVTNYPGRC